MKHPTRIGKYVVIGEIGRGAMGVVYRAMDPQIGRTVALKTIRFDHLVASQDIEMAKKRFLREAHSAGALSHPNIVTIFDVGEDEGLSYIAMEHIEGQSLEGLLGSHTKLSLEDILSLVYQVAEGLECAHAKGIVHRDIKPANILIDIEGRPRIVDFGIARIPSSTMTQTNVIMGTPFYMSPEHISGKKVDRRTDIFALGVILYELLTGEKPFQGDSLTTVIYRIMNEEPPPASTKNRGVSPDLEAIVRRAMAKSPEARYQTCRELNADVGQCLRRMTSGVHTITMRTPVSTISTPILAPGSVPPPRGARPRPVVLVLALMIVTLAVVIGVLLFIPKPTGTVASAGPGGGAPGVLSLRTPAGPTPSAADTAFAQGEQFFERKDWQAAIHSYEQVPETSPHYLEARLRLASIEKEQGRTDLAAAEINQLLVRNPDDARPYLLMAELQEAREDWASAVANYERYLERAPGAAEGAAVRKRIASLSERLKPGPRSEAQQGVLPVLPGDGASSRGRPVLAPEAEGGNISAGIQERPAQTKGVSSKTTAKPQPPAKTGYKVKGMTANNLILIDAGARQGMRKGFRGLVTSFGSDGQPVIVARFVIVQVMPSYSYARLTSMVDSIQPGYSVEVLGDQDKE